MKRPFLVRSLFLLCFVTAMSVGALGQADSRNVEPSYDVILQLVHGSNDSTAKTEIPANLSAISKQIRGNFAYSNYRLAGTYLGRINNMGSFESKSMTVPIGSGATLSRPMFLDWTLADLKSGPLPSGREGYQARAFRFGARVPVVAMSGEGPGASTVVNYESIGVTVSRIGLVENSPTLVGTVNLPGMDGVVFLVMTVRSADL